MADSFKNTSGEAMPPYAIFQVVGGVQIAGSRLLEAKKPIQTNRVPSIFYFNRLTEIPNNKTGRGRRATAGSVWGRYNSSDGTPAFGQMWGPDGSSWELRKNKPGFLVVGAPQDGAVLVVEEVGPIIRYAELTADLAKASNMKTGETTAAAKFIVNDPSSHGNWIDGAAFTVTNRWKNFELESGKRLRVTWDWHTREWIPDVSECPGSE